MSVIVIRVNGVDITDDVQIKEAEFTTQATGGPGLCRFKVRDHEHTYAFTVGDEITLDIDGTRMWGGYLMSVNRQYDFPAQLVVNPRNPCDPIEFTSRGLLLEGADYNILFRKRVVFNTSDPTDGELRKWPAGSNDSDIIKYLCDNHLDLSGDGLDTETLVEHVGSPNPDDAASPYSPSWTWEEAMRAIAWLPGALYYINPDKQLVYTDVDIPSAPYGLSDTPNYTVDVTNIAASDGEQYTINAPTGESLSHLYDGGQSRITVDVSGGLQQGVENREVGYRDMEILRDGTKLINDAFVWGAGQGSQSIAFYRATDEDSIAEHERWQWGDFRVDMWRNASVQHRAESVVYGSPQSKRGGKDDAISVNCTVKVPYFRVADKVIFNSNVFGFSDVIPIRRQRITFVSPTAALYELTLSHFIDEPWNIVEFYLPPIGRRKPPEIIFPPIIIPEEGDPLCPVPVDGSTIIFADDFNRTSGQPPTTSGGFWAVTGGASPYPLNGQGQTLSTATSRYIAFGELVIPSNYVVKADWTGLTGVFGTGFTSERVGIGIGSGLVTLTASLEGNRINPPYTPTRLSAQISTNVAPSTLQRPIYIRWLQNDTMAGVRIWGQDEPEPGDWLLQMDIGDVSAANGPSPSIYDYETLRLKMHPASIFLMYATAPLDAVTMYGVPPSAQGDGGLGGMQGETTNSWRVTWQQAHPGGGTWVSAPTSNSVVMTETSSGDISSSVPAYSCNIHWPQFSPTAATGYMSEVNQTVRNFRVGTSVFTQSGFDPPISATLTGEFAVGIDNGGISSTSPYPPPGLPFPVPCEFFVANYGDDPIGGQPFAYPYSILGTVKTTVQALAHPNGGALNYIPFTMNLLTSDFVGDRLQWGVRFQDAEAVATAVREAGYFGPFFFPNARVVSIRLQNIVFRAIWPAYPQGVHFCIPPHQTGNNLVRQCETMDVPAGLGGGPKTFQVSKPYMPQTLEVSIDGLNLRRGFDFTEYDPPTGRYMLFLDLTNARQMRTCYFAE